jgi:hypothetical protein
VPSLKLIDFVSYVAQTTDISQGRVPDGSGPYQFFTAPTPGMSNVPTTAPSIDSAAAAGALATAEQVANAEIDRFFERVGQSALRRPTASPATRDAWTANYLLNLVVAARRAERGDEAALLAFSDRSTGDDDIVIDEALVLLTRNSGAWPSTGGPGFML